MIRNDEVTGGDDMSKSSRDREIARRRHKIRVAMSRLEPGTDPEPPRPPQAPEPPRPPQAPLPPFALPPAYYENVAAIRRAFGVTPPPRTWRADPVRTFYFGLALGLVPLVLVMSALFIAGVLP